MPKSVKDLQKVRIIRNPEEYGTRKAMADGLRQLADKLEQKDDGQLCKAYVQVSYATPLEVQRNLERLANRVKNQTGEGK